MAESEKTITFDVQGFEELARRARRPDIMHRPVRKAMSRSALFVQREGAKIVPVDTGRLKGSISTEIDPSPLPEWAKIGPNLEKGAYGKYVEFGTKYQKAQPYMRPALQMAKGGGINPFWRRAGQEITRALARR